MKKIIIIVWLSILSSNLFSQNMSLKATYTKSLTKPVISLSQKEDETSRILQRFENEAIILLKEIKFELIVKDTKSLFFANDNNLLASNKNYINAIGIGINLKGQFYTDVAKNELLNQKESLGEFFIIQGEIDKYKWILHNETKQIGQFLCYKATTVEEIVHPFLNKIVKKMITCWYTPEIPVKCGIGNYTNLPGLVVLLETENATMTLNELIINPKTAIEIKKPSKGKLISEAEFNNIGKEMARNSKNRKGF